MSTSGRGGDALTQAGRLRARNARMKAAVGNLGDEAHLAPIPVDASDELWAARSAARGTMLTHHGCTGRQCRRRGHSAGWVAMRQVLEALGLEGARDGRDERLSEWGYRRKASVSRLKPP